MICILDVFTDNERNFARQLPLSARKSMGKSLTKGSQMKGDLSQGFGGPKQHYQRSFEKLALRKAGYKKNVKYIGAGAIKKMKPMRKAA
ncbi:MAG: hypothetical protein R3250_03185 [Melioribacteraceae bacterium]|nr:hypothetical protein [Melioribacteraceae bacterium]